MTRNNKKNKKNNKNETGAESGLGVEAVAREGKEYVFIK